ncbi:hypothetical protein V2J09_013846 [Rumex salicifolius]
METKISGSQATEVCQTLKARFPNSKRVEAQGFKGGPWLLWDGNIVDIQVITKADHFIRARARKGNLLAEFYFVYGPPTVHRRRWFWTDLRNEINLLHGPLFMAGDFNCNLSMDERIGGSGGLHPDSAEFQALIDDLALVDLGFSGQKSTWSRGDSTLDPIASQNQHQRPFKFEGTWLLHPSFRELLDEAWNGENDVEEEVHWFQKSKELWLQAGDRNTAFFHTSTLIRRKRSRILTLKSGDETWVEEPEALERLAVDFFRQPYHLLVEDLFYITSPHGLFPVLTVDRWWELEKPFSDEELHKAMSTIGAYKALGPDGFQPCFFQKCWDTVGSSMLATVHRHDVHSWPDEPIFASSNQTMCLSYEKDTLRVEGHFELWYLVQEE